MHKAIASTSGTRALNLKRILDELVDWRYKSFFPGPVVPIRAVGERGWNVLGGAFSQARVWRAFGARRIILAGARRSGIRSLGRRGAAARS